MGLYISRNLPETFYVNIIDELNRCNYNYCLNCDSSDEEVDMERCVNEELVANVISIPLEMNEVNDSMNEMNENNSNEIINTADSVDSPFGFHHI